MILPRELCNLIVGFAGRLRLTLRCVRKVGHRGACSALWDNAGR